MVFGDALSGATKVNTHINDTQDKEKQDKPRFFAT